MSQFNVIFLDIDGVVNLKPESFDEYWQCFHQPWVDNLARIVAATGAKIVVSSTWRFSGLSVIQEMWQKRGLPGEVIDVTGILFYGRYQVSSPTTTWQQVAAERSVPRGCEIDCWLRSRGFTRTP
jgi:uncharacterized membrane protein